MRTLLRHVGARLRTTLWAIPSLMAVAAALLAWGTLSLDAASGGGVPVPQMLRFEAGNEAARGLLTTITGAMMGVVGVTFSITIVILSLASQQFGPRLLRSFLRDVTTQIVFGAFVSTFLFGLLVLRALPSEGTLPHLSLLVSISLSIASLGMLLYYVHHVAHSIQADAIVAEVAADLERGSRSLYPSGIGKEPEEEERITAPADAHVVRSKRSGYLQAVQKDRVMELARKSDVTVEVLHRPGDFVVAGMPVLRAWPAANLAEDWDDDARKVLLLGRLPTYEQDLEFSISQLVEVAVRSLSPSINDPVTAMRCLDRIGEAMCRLAPEPFPSTHRADEDGRVRVVCRRLDFAGVLDTAFARIRQYGRRSASVSIRMLEVLEVVASATGDAGRRADLREQADRILRDAAHAGHSPPDLAVIRSRHADFAKALGGSPLVHGLEGRDGQPAAPRKRQRGMVRAPAEGRRRARRPGGPGRPAARP